MKNSFEKKENLIVTTETITTDKLIDLIYKGETLPQDNRFLPTEKGGVFGYFELKYIGDHKDDKFYLIVKIGDKIVGLSELLKDPYNKNNLWIQFISVGPKEQGKGYASKLLEEIFNFAEQNGYSLESSSYATEDSFNKLASKHDELARKHPNVKYINKGRI